MALIGEQFDEADEICGVVASVRQRGDKLALWTKTASNEAVQVHILSKMNLSNQFHQSGACLLINMSVAIFSYHIMKIMW